MGTVPSTSSAHTFNPAAIVTMYNALADVYEEMLELDPHERCNSLLKVENALNEASLGLAKTREATDFNIPLYEAAPELLEACKFIYEEFSRRAQNPFNRKTKLNALEQQSFNQLKLAIAKAKGRA